MNNQLIVLAIKDFLADVEKQNGCHIRFSDFLVLIFHRTVTLALL